MIKVDEDRANSAGVVLLFQKVEACPQISDRDFRDLRSPCAIRHPRVRGNSTFWGDMDMASIKNNAIVASHREKGSIPTP
jgi:inhibitor of KinA sporulation pathway (predicted exonuclease)